MSEYAVELRNVVKQFPNPGGGEVTAVDHVEYRRSAMVSSSRCSGLPAVEKRPPCA